jgi:small subunit ribosomal protein S8
MGMTDPIADMLTRIRNANRMKFRSVNTLPSKINLGIAKVLKKTGYISGYDMKRDQNKREVLRVYMKYTETKDHVLTDIQRVSKPGRRIYVKGQKIPRVLNGFGVAILSTSKGILTDKEAQEQNVGGEILCNVW